MHPFASHVESHHLKATVVLLLACFPLVFALCICLYGGEHDYGEFSTEGQVQTCLREQELTS